MAQKANETAHRGTARLWRTSAARTSPRVAS